MAKHARTPPPDTNEPITPSHIYRVIVERRLPGTNIQWVKDFDATTSAQTPLGAMQGIVSAETAKMMLALRRDIEEPGMPAFTHCLNCTDDTCTLLSGCKDMNASE